MIKCKRAVWIVKQAMDYGDETTVPRPSDVWIKSKKVKSKLKTINPKRFETI